MARTDLTERKPAPSDPFETSHERAYPRVGIRKNGNLWRVTLWAGPDQPFREYRVDCATRAAATAWAGALVRWHPQQDLVA